MTEKHVCFITQRAGATFYAVGNNDSGHGTMQPFDFAYFEPKMLDIENFMFRGSFAVLVLCPGVMQRARFARAVKHRPARARARHNQSGPRRVCVGNGKW